jgi:predicted Zn finger-like uncharacterized protein
MNVSCTSCHTIYRVDPRKVPEAGVRARCSACRAVFAVGRQPAGGEPEAPRASAPVAAPPAPAPTPEPAPAPATPAPTAPEPTAAVDEDVPRFGGQDPHAKAQRLARALVSDMIVYHPERHQRGLREGTLRQEFRDEIRKSWEEYVDQVGREMAHGTPYFRDALNRILARGQQVF